jgi:hypothetical protein
MIREQIKFPEVLLFWWVNCYEKWDINCGLASVVQACIAFDFFETTSREYVIMSLSMLIKTELIKLVN